MLLLRAVGYFFISDITFALFRRFRELVRIGIGLACLAVVGRRLSAPQEDSTS